MTGPLPPMSRLVRCPKCHRVLQEPINFPVYKCGGCDTVLKAKICKNGTKDTDVHVPDSNMGNKKESEQDSEGNEAQNLSKEDREARSLSKEERLSSSGELPLDKNNGSDEKENEDSNMNQSGITHHGNEESLPVAEADQDKCSLKQNKGGYPKEYVQHNGKHFRLVNFSDEVDSPTEPNHHKTVESEPDKGRNCMEEENGVNFSDEVALPTEPDRHKSAERLSSAGELPLDINNGSDEMENKDSNMNLSGITRHRNEEMLPVTEAVHDKSSSKQNNGGNPEDYVQCTGKHVGGINFSDEVASPTEPNHHKSAEREVDKTRNGMEEENGVVNFSYEVASPTELNHRKSAERLSSAGALLLDKSNGSEEMENKDGNMNQSGITHHGNEESLPVAEADQDKCSLKQNKGGNPKEYVQHNGKHFRLVNFSDEVDSPTEPNHHKTAESELDKGRNCMEEENGGNFSDEVALPTEPDRHKSAERLSSAGELPLDINNGSDEMENKDSNMNLSGITRHRNEEMLPVTEAVHDKSSSKQNNGGNPEDYVQCTGKHVGGINFSDEVASPTEPNHHKSAEREVDKTRNGMEEENGVVNFSYEVASPTELNHRKSAERLSSAGALLLDKSNGSEEMENKDGNMNQSGITRHGIEESLPVAEDKCSLKQSNGGNPDDYVQHNRKHVGGINFSDEVVSPTEPNHHKSVESEADKNGNCVEEENGGVNISDEVASSTELNHLDSEESSLVAEGRSEVDEIGCCLEQENGRNQNKYVICNGKQTGGITELNDNVIEESSPVVRASTEANENRTFLEQNNRRNQSEFGDVKRGTLSRNSKSSEVSLSTDRACQEIEELTAVIETNRKLDENSKSPMSLDQTQKRQLAGFECGGSVDTLGNIAVANYSSEFSVTHRDMHTFPTASNYGYEGSVSSYDGNDDQVPDPFLHLYERKFKKAKSPKAKAMHKRDEVMNKITSYPDMEHEAWNCSSIPSEKKRYTRKGKWHQDELMEPTRHGPPARSRTKFESGGYQSRVPFYSRGSHVGYDKGGPSNYRREEFQYRSCLHSPNKPEKNPEEEKMELLKRVIELQEQLTRTHISQGVAPKVDMYPRRFHQGTRWPHQNRTSRIPFSAEAKMSGCQVDNSCFHCCPHDRMSSAPLPPHVFCNRSPYTAQPSPRYSNLYSPTPSSPQYRASSEFSLQSYDANCDDRELKKYYRERNRLKRHVRPVAGGAPFIICYRCSEVLQVPLDFLLGKRRFHKLMCGACSSTLKFSLQDRTCISPYTDDYALDAVAPPPSEVDDYGPSLGKSCSTEVEPFSVELPFQSVKRDSYERKTSFESFSEPTGERKGGPILYVPGNKNKNPVETFAAAGPSASKAGKTSSEIEELRPTSGSPLHALMGYTSPSRVMDR